MILRRSLNHPAVMIRIGAASLLLANLSRWFIQPAADFSRGFWDVVTGLLFGIAIASLLIGVRLNVRRRSGTPGGWCA